MVIAGEIEASGKKVTRFKKGDRVFGVTGMTMGTYSEYVYVPDKRPWKNK
jgi:NADPH:quinone reductase-like Zn-dependent oxidoreductase